VGKAGKGQANKGKNLLPWGDGAVKESVWLLNEVIPKPYLNAVPRLMFTRDSVERKSKLIGNTSSMNKKAKIDHGKGITGWF